MNDDLLSKISELGEEMEIARKEYDELNNTWWQSLTERERQDAFYAVCKRIHRGDVVEQGSYRYVLYDVFEFGPDMYGAGMDCGYMSIHNILYEGLKLNRMHLVNRLEVIDETGRAYTKYLDPAKDIDYNLQDDGKTLKIFLPESSANYGNRYYDEEGKERISIDPITGNVGIGS